MSRLTAACLICCLSIAGLPAFAAGEDAAPVRLAQASAPADNAIANARKDLDRYENQAKGVRPGASSAKRILKLPS